MGQSGAVKDEREKLTVGMCYSKVKAMKYLYRKEENMEFTVNKGFQAGPGAKHPDEHVAAQVHL